MSLQWQPLYGHIKNRHIKNRRIKKRIKRVLPTLSKSCGVHHVFARCHAVVTDCTVVGESLCTRFATLVIHHLRFGNYIEQRVRRDTHTPHA